MKNPSITFPPNILTSYQFSHISETWFHCLFYKIEIGGGKCIFKIFVCILIFAFFNLVIWHLVFNIQEHSRPYISLIKLRKTLVTISLKGSN